MRNDEAIAVLSETHLCAVSWEADARLLGNVRALDLARALVLADIALRSQAGQEVVAQAKAAAFDRIVDTNAHACELSSVVSEEYFKVRVVQDEALERAQKGTG